MSKKRFSHVLEISDEYDGEKKDGSSKIESRILFKFKKDKIKLGKNIPIKGCLAVGDEVGIFNAPIEVYFNNDFIKTIITNDEGLFKAFIPNEVPGNHSIKLLFRGTWQYSSCTASKQIPYADRKGNDDLINQLERLARLHESGHITDEEFKAFKLKLLSQ